MFLPLQELLGLSPLGEDTGSAAVLAEKILTTCEKGERVIFFRGNLAKETMGEVLEKGGLLVEQLVVYETKESVELEKDLASISRPLDWIVLFSPSGARAVLPLLDRLFGERSCKLVAIGETSGSGQDPISTQGRAQGRKFRVWVLISQELRWNPPREDCWQCSKAVILSEAVDFSESKRSSCSISSLGFSRYSKRDIFVSEIDLLAFLDEEDKRKGGSGPQLVVSLWLCV